MVKNNNKFISPEIKLKAVKDILEHKSNTYQVAKKLGIRRQNVSLWVMNYKNEGAEAFSPKKGKKTYPVSLMENAAKDYLDGKGSYIQICKKYKIRSPRVLADWVKHYNIHGELDSYAYQERCDKSMKGKASTLEERCKIVKECLESNRDYRSVAEKYGYSYRQVYNWVKRYEKDGNSGLANHQGRPKKKPLDPSHKETKDEELVRLRQEVKDLKLENLLLKKLDELTKRNRFR
ncbi:MAG: transposase [Acidaminococcus sp.]|jgi:transposase-like protein|nr:transposase [Acidaminococcus sp.]